MVLHGTYLGSLKNIEVDVEGLNAILEQLQDQSNRQNDSQIRLRNLNYNRKTIIINSDFNISMLQTCSRKTISS